MEVLEEESIFNERQLQMEEEKSTPQKKKKNV
jgi:hypothetical protein